jgi:hypothetical protein
MTRADTDIHSVAFFTADHAAVENGKTYVNGGFWDSMALPSFPTAVSLSVVAVLRVPWHAYHHRHSFTVTVEDADGKKLPVEFKGDFQVGTAPDMKVGQPTILPIAAVANGMPIERPGDISFVLSVDGGEIDRWTVHVNQVGVQVIGVPGSSGPSAIPELP